jgi:O-antigen/teichoic acid export membrane protein
VLNYRGRLLRVDRDEYQRSTYGGRQFRQAWLLTLGSFGSYGLSFLRNLMLARLLTKADYGVAALLANTLLMLEIASRMSFGQQIVQSPDGASRAFRDSAHLFQLATCLVGALVIITFGLTAAPRIVSVGLSWTVFMLAAVPFARALENLDVFREQRRFNQLPALLCEFVPQLVVTLATWPLVLWLGDIRVVLVILIAKPVLGLATSHIVAKEPYGLAWNAAHFRAIAMFGWPLVFNGVLIFASQQADQFLIAAAFSKQELAEYALVFAAVNVPWAVFAQPYLAVMLPVLSSAQNQPTTFRKHYRSSVELAAVASMALTLPFIVFGEQLVTFLYGSKYAGAGPLMALLGAATAIRFLRFTPALASMALADTRNQLIASVVRSISLPVAALVIAGGWRGTVGVAAAALIGEVAAAAVSVWRLARRQDVPLNECYGSAIFMSAFLTMAAAMNWVGVSDWGITPAAFGIVVTPLSVLAVGWITFPGVLRPGSRVLFGK